MTSADIPGGEGVFSNIPCLSFHYCITIFFPLPPPPKKKTSNTPTPLFIDVHRFSKQMPTRS
jgi:hypothetical protein